MESAHKLERLECLCSRWVHQARRFEPLIDRSEIYAFEDWWKRIEALISRADTINAFRS